EPGPNSTTADAPARSSPSTIFLARWIELGATAPITPGLATNSLRNRRLTATRCLPPGDAPAADVEASGEVALWTVDVTRKLPSRTPGDSEFSARQPAVSRRPAGRARVPPMPRGRLSGPRVRNSVRLRALHEAPEDEQALTIDASPEGIYT